jgi:hypothetical protein
MYNTFFYTELYLSNLLPRPPIALEGRLRQEQTLGAATLGSSPLVMPPPECATGTTWAAS